MTQCGKGRWGGGSPWTPEKAHAYGVASNTRRCRMPKDYQGPHATGPELHALLIAAKGCCHWCGREVGRLEFDHVVPIKHGGSNGIDNIVMACRKCNRSRPGGGGGRGRRGRKVRVKLLWR